MLQEEVIKCWGLPRKINIEKSVFEKETVAYPGQKASYGHSYAVPIKEHWFYSRKEPDSGLPIGKRYIFPSFSDWKDFYVVELIFWNGKLVDSNPKIEIINQAQVPRSTDAHK